LAPNFKIEAADTELGEPVITTCLPATGRQARGRDCTVSVLPKDLNFDRKAQRDEKKLSLPENFCRILQDL
jgi:hypothetical protein